MHSFIYSFSSCDGLSIHIKIKLYSIQKLLEKNERGFMWIVRSGQEHVTYGRPHNKKVKITIGCIRKIYIPD